MNGTTVNWYLPNILSKEHNDRQLPKLVNIGNCNLLHVLHEVFQKGAESTGWKLKSRLKHLHYLFYNAGDQKWYFVKILGSKLFPLSFYNKRCVDSKLVLDQSKWSLVKWGTESSLHTVGPNRSELEIGENNQNFQMFLTLFKNNYQIALEFIKRIL